MEQLFKSSHGQFICRTNVKACAECRHVVVICRHVASPRHRWPHSSFAKSPLHTLGTILQLSERAENASVNRNAPMQAADYVPYDLGDEGLWFAAVDRELAHAVSQSSALKTKSVGGPIRTSDDPVRRMQHMKNVFSLHGFQR
jgi:hypothetical protein